MNYLAIRYLLPFALFPFSSGVSAIGLGELHGQPALGERIQLEIDLLGSDTQKLDASCFRNWHIHKSFWLYFFLIVFN